MLVDFNELPDHSRIWVYQSNRSFTEEEQKELEESLTEFLKEWTAHGSDLNAGFEMKYKRFIVIGLDQTNVSASGCSIDASVHFIQSLEQNYKPLKDFKKLAKAKSVSPNTIVFNNLVATKQEYLENWEVPASESWHSRFV